ncbi:hypothetical protein PVL29_015892 [Vitis rotundifolia]|uniref:S-protein homolog n=1 Tax=Vitis rotundifolia TaxID=103349 RepID=A0AA38ZE56_VITRO|nr:hypothetical protein PVL29_015892 [Vitis rotundifolia]
MGWPKESRDMDYPLWTRLYMFVVRVTNPKDGTLHLVTLCQGLLPMLRKTHVRLTNLLGEGSSLTIHCKSKDDDLGVHVLPFKGSFEWSFKPNFFVKNTLFFCNIQWQGKSMYFNSYDEERDLEGCGKYCYWDVTLKGPCLLKHKGGYDFCSNWPNKKSVGIKQGDDKNMP